MDLRVLSTAQCFQLIYCGFYRKFMLAFISHFLSDRDRIIFLRTHDRPIWNENRAELERIRDEFIWGIIAGQRPVSDFDQFVEIFNASGGEAAARETEELYALQAAELEVFLEKHGRH